MAQAPAPTVPTTDAPSTTTPAVRPTYVEVKRFELVGSSLLKDEDVQRELSPWLGRQSVDGLQQAAAAAQRLFTQAGYGSVAVSLPPQVIGPDGVVQLRVLVGKLTVIRVHGANATFDESNVRASLPALVPNETPQLHELDAQLRLIQQNPAKRVDVLLLPGDAPATTHAEVVVQPGARVFDTSVTAENTGDERSGHWRLGIEARHANASGHDDVLSARLLTSDHPDRVKVAMLAWRLPSYSRRLMIDSYVAYSRIDGGSTVTSAGDLRFQGSGRLAGLRATHYLLRTGGGEHSVSAAIDYRALRNQCSLGNLPGGACGEAGANLTLRPLRLGYEWSYAGETALGFGAEWRHNLASRGSRVEAFEGARPGARADYSLVQANARIGGFMDDGSRWQTRVALQWTDRPLPGAEQYGVGGAATVRGYGERVLVGDRGATLSFEWIGEDRAASPAPPPRITRAAWSLRPVTFVESGWVANVDGLECRAARTHCNVASLGAGIRWSGVRGSLQLDAALPLKVDASSPNGNVRLHVSSQWRL